MLLKYSIVVLLLPHRSGARQVAASSYCSGGDSAGLGLGRSVDYGYVFYIAGGPLLCGLWYTVIVAAFENHWLLWSIAPLCLLSLHFHSFLKQPAFGAPKRLALLPDQVNVVSY